MRVLLAQTKFSMARGARIWVDVILVFSLMTVLGAWTSRPNCQATPGTIGAPLLIQREYSEIPVMVVQIRSKVAPFARSISDFSFDIIHF